MMYRYRYVPVCTANFLFINFDYEKKNLLVLRRRVRSGSAYFVFDRSEPA